MFAQSVQALIPGLLGARFLTLSYPASMRWSRCKRLHRDGVASYNTVL